MYFNTNIKFLRKRKSRTQDDLALLLGIPRSTLNNYENKIAYPGINLLIAISDYFGIAIDTLIKVDLTKLAESQLSQLERGYDVFIRGSNLRVLTTTVNSENEENIELVSEKAKAGYSSGFADPEYIRILPTFQLPFLSPEKKYRTFQISGDSMLPIPNGSWVTGEFVQNWELIRNRQAYIILTLNEGILFKVVENLIPENGQLRLHSLNPIYLPYSIHINEIREVWKFVHYISTELPEERPAENRIMDEIAEIKADVKSLSERIGKQP
ncbi:MAG: LexA family transcriptional regulator [Sphingobacteriia bacterium]|nr:LexA family transcriptional regulator [Sphingobacteriia bacterium]